MKMGKWEEFMGWWCWIEGEGLKVKMKDKMFESVL